jgi:hypothetical protein
MTGEWQFKLSLELVAHDAMQDLIGHLQSKLLPEPVLDRHMAGEARSSRETRFELCEDGGRQRFLPRWCPRLFVGQKRRKATVSIQSAPACDGIAVDGKMSRRLAPRRDLPGLEEDQQMQAGPQLGLTLTAQAC